MKGIVVTLEQLGIGTGITGSDIDDAVAKKHDRQHSIVASADHSDKGDYACYIGQGDDQYVARLGNKISFAESENVDCIK